MPRKRERTYSGSWGTWQDLLTKLEAKIAELPQLEPFRVKLAAILVQVLSISQQQDDMRASKQSASKQLRKLTAEGNRAAALLRVAIKDHYGPDEEKVAAFGLQPFRGRKVTPDSEEPAPEQLETPTLPAPIGTKP